MTDTQPLAPTDAEIFAVAREAGLLPDNSHPAPETRAARKHSDAVRAFARAALAKWGMLRADRIVIPTDTMEQEFQKHYQRGYEAGKKATTQQPTQPQARRDALEEAAAAVEKATPTPQADGQPAPDEIINMAREQGLPETEIEGVFRVNADDLCRVAAAILAARAPADSVLEDAAQRTNHAD